MNTLAALSFSTKRFFYYFITCLIICSIYVALLIIVFDIKHPKDIKQIGSIIFVFGGFPILISSLSLAIYDATKMKTTLLKNTFTLKTLKVWSLLLVLLIALIFIKCIDTYINLHYNLFK